MKKKSDNTLYIKKPNGEMVELHNLEMMNTEHNCPDNFKLPKSKRRKVTFKIEDDFLIEFELMLEDKKGNRYGPVKGSIAKNHFKETFGISYSEYLTQIKQHATNT